MPDVVEPALRHRLTRARTRLRWAFGWLPGAVLLACVGMVVITAIERGGVDWWLVLPVVGAAAPFVLCQTARVQPPRWPHTAFLTAAGQLLLGAIPAYGMTPGPVAGPASPLFALAWVNLIGAVLASRAAFVALMTPLTPELGSLPLELRFGVRTAIERPDSITTGVTVGLTHVVAHARRHVAYSRGNPGQIAVPLAAVTGVRTVTLGRMGHWLTLSDGTPLLATPGPAVALATGTGDFLIPTDDAARVAGIIARRVRSASLFR